MSKHVVGIDVGGTSVKIGVFTTDRVLVDNWSIGTTVTNNGHGIVREIASSIENFLTRNNMNIHDLVGAGMGIPGFIDHVNNVVFEAVNIGWKNYPAGDELTELLGIPVWIENDANLAALGEYHHAKPTNPSSLLFVTLGTGVGGAIIVDDEILIGNSGSAGEIGHTVVDRNSQTRCNCGRYGCLDTIASTSGINRLAQSKLVQHPDSPLTQHKHSTRIESSDVFQYAQSGDTLALEIVEYMTECLGYALANATMIVNPTQIVIGGGLSHYGEFFLDKVTKHFSFYVLDRLAEETKISLAVLGNRAGIIGAGTYASQQVRKTTRSLL